MPAKLIAEKMRETEVGEIERQSDEKPSVIVAVKIVLALTVLYAFLVSIGLMGAGFKVFGKDFARTLIETTNNPFIGLFIGIFATAIIQSSSTTTSMVVAFVASGTLTVNNAIPVVMGANIGTAVTCQLVALGHVSRRQEFRRAFAAGNVHDLFNLMAVIVLFPIEITTGYLSKSAHAVSGLLAGASGMEFKSPLKMVTKPVCTGIVDGISYLELDKIFTGLIVVALGIGLLIISLVFLTKLLKSLLFSKIEVFFSRSMGDSGFFLIILGLVFTMLVQSSSVTTSLMVPMAAAAVITLDQVFPVALGANLGTTITALLASLATGRPEALTIAIVHTLFNLSGILIFYPLPFMRKIPLFAARWLADKAGKNRLIAVAYIVTIYFVIPCIAIFLT